MATWRKPKYGLLAAILLLVASLSAIGMQSRECTKSTCGVECPMHEKPKEERGCCSKKAQAKAAEVCKCKISVPSDVSAVLSVTENVLKFLPVVIPTTTIESISNEAPVPCEPIEVANHGPPGSGQYSPESPRAPPSSR